MGLGHVVLLTDFGISSSDNMRVSYVWILFGGWPSFRVTVCCACHLTVTGLDTIQERFVSLNPEEMKRRLNLVLKLKILS